MARRRSGDGAATRTSPVPPQAVTNMWLDDSWQHPSGVTAASIAAATSMLSSFLFLAGFNQSLNESEPDGSRARVRVDRLVRGIPPAMKRCGPASVWAGRGSEACPRNRIVTQQEGAVEEVERSPGAVQRCRRTRYDHIGRRSRSRWSSARTHSCDTSGGHRVDCSEQRPGYAVAR
jgi:hypothetical protein